MLENDISRDLRAALKAGDKLTVSSLRMLMAEVKNKKIEERADELKDSDLIRVIQKMVKRHKESIAKFEEGGRSDLAEKEANEMSVLEKYLPEMMTEEEIASIVDEEVRNAGASSIRDMGKVMGAVIARVEGRAEGGTISGLVKKRLS